MADNNQLKYGSTDRLLYYQNNILTRCCCEEQQPEDRYFEAIPCDISIENRGEYCSDYDQCQFSDRIYVSRLARCGGMGGNPYTMCEAQRLLLRKYESIQQEERSDLVRLRPPSDFVPATGEFYSNSMVLKTTDGITTINYADYTCLEELSDYLDELGWTLQGVPSEVLGGVPRILAEQTLFWNSYSYQFLTTKKSSFQLRWNGTTSDVIYVSGDNNEFITVLQNKINNSWGGGNISVLRTDIPEYDYYRRYSFEDSLYEIIFSGALCGAPQSYIELVDPIIVSTDFIKIEDASQDEYKTVELEYGDYTDFTPLPNSYPRVMEVVNDLSSECGLSILDESIDSVFNARGYFVAGSSGIRATIDNFPWTGGQDGELPNEYPQFKYTSFVPLRSDDANYPGWPIPFTGQYQASPQRGFSLGEEQRILTNCSGYGFNHCSGDFLDRARDFDFLGLDFTNLNRSLVINGNCYSISPFWFTAHKEGRASYDYYLSEPLYELPQNEIDINNNITGIPSNCLPQLFLPQFNKDVPWGPFWKWVNSRVSLEGLNTFDRRHIAYTDYNDSHINNTYSSSQSYGFNYKPDGWMKTRGTWLETTQIELFINVHMPMPFYVGSDPWSGGLPGDFIEQEIKAQIDPATIDPDLTVTQSTNCNSISISFDTTNKTVGDFVSKVNALKYSGYDCFVFAFCLASPDVTGLPANLITNVHSDIFHNNLLVNENSYTNHTWVGSDGPLQDDQILSGSDIIVGPLSHNRLYRYGIRNSSSSVQNCRSWIFDLFSSYFRGAVCRTPFKYNDYLGLASNAPLFDQYASFSFNQSDAHPGDDGKFFNPPPYKSVLFHRYPNYGVTGYYLYDKFAPIYEYDSFCGLDWDGGFTFEPELEVPTTDIGSSPWWTPMRITEEPVIKISKSTGTIDSDHNPQSTQVTVSGQKIYVLCSGAYDGDPYRVSGILDTDKSGASYTVAECISDLNSLTINMPSTGSWNPVYATGGEFFPKPYEIWLDDHTWEDGSGDPVREGAVGAVQTATNYAYKEPLVNMTGFYELNNAPSYQFNATIRERWASGIYQEKEPWCLPYSATRVEPGEVVDCEGASKQDSDFGWLLSRGCAGISCITEYYIPADYCTCATVYRCDGNGNIASTAHDYQTLQPRLYVCKDNFHNDCDHPMMVRVPRVLWDGEDVTVIREDTEFSVSPVPRVNNVYMEKESRGWCQYIDPATSTVSKESIPATYPPTSIIAQKSAGVFCSFKPYPWSVENDFRICADSEFRVLGGFYSSSDFDRIENCKILTTEEEQNRSIFLEHNVLFRPAIDDLTINEICSSGTVCGAACCEWQVPMDDTWFIAPITCGTKCCECSYSCESGCVDNLIGNSWTQVSTYDYSFSDPNVPFTCPFEEVTSPCEVQQGCCNRGQFDPSVGECWCGTSTETITDTRTKTLRTLPFARVSCFCGVEGQYQRTKTDSGATVSPGGACYQWVFEPNNINIIQDEFSCDEFPGTVITDNDDCGSPTIEINTRTNPGESCTNGGSIVCQINSDDDYENCYTNNRNDCGYGTASFNGSVTTYLAGVSSVDGANLGYESNGQPAACDATTDHTKTWSGTYTVGTPNEASCPDTSPSTNIRWNLFTSGVNTLGLMCGTSNFNIVATGLDSRFPATTC